MTHAHFALTATDDGLYFFYGTQSYAVARTHPNYLRIAEALREKDVPRALLLLDDTAAVAAFTPTDPAFTVTPDGLLALDGEPFTKDVSAKVVSMVRAGASPEPLQRCLRKLRRNQRASAQRELLLFLAASGFPIHEDGDIIGYKKVRADYFDIHSGTVCYRPAALMEPDELARYTTPVTGLGKEGNVTIEVVDGLTTVSMPIHAVDDDRQQTCSYGLHVAAHDYAKNFGSGRLVVVKINPEDVVSVPYDYGNQKMRVARLQVVAEIVDPAQFARGMKPREVYDDAALGVGTAVVPSMAQVVQEEVANNTVAARVARLLADVAPDDLEATQAEILERYLNEVRRDEYTAVLDDYVEAWRVWVFVDSLVRELDLYDYREALDLVCRSETKLVAVVEEVMRLLDEKDAAEDAPEDEEDEKPDFSELIDELKEQIFARVIVDGVTFRRAVEDRGESLDDDDLVDALTDAGMGRWL